MRILSILVLVAACLPFSWSAKPKPPVNGDALFQHPEHVKIGDNFVSSCVIRLKPKANDYNVTYYFGDQALGQYVVRNQLTNDSRVVTWETLKCLPGLNIYATKKTVAGGRFDALFEPYSKEALGEYRCSVSLHLENNEARAQFYSEKWLAKEAESKPGLLPDVSLTFNTSRVLNGIQAFDYFVGMCTVQLRPNDTSYYVSIYLQKEPGQRFGATYSVKQEDGVTSVTYTKLSDSQYYGLTFQKHVDQYPNFSLLFNPTEKQNIQWKFTCELQVTLANDGTGLYTSNKVCSLPKSPCNF